MKVKRYDNSPDRRVLIGMVVDASVLLSIIPKWTAEGLFASPWENAVGAMCVDFGRRHGKAPGRAIETMIGERPGRRGEDETAAIEKFVAALSTEYEANGEALPASYVIDLSRKVFNRVAKRRAAEGILEDLERGDDDAADEKASLFRPIEIGVDAVDKLDTDYTPWLELDAEDEEPPVVTYGGALGEFWGKDLSRGCFVAYMAAEKRGKSWWLLDMVVQGLRGHRRVAYFEVGDMSRLQTMRRLRQRLTRRPATAKLCQIPTGWDTSGDVPIPKYEMRDLDAATSKAAFATIGRYGRGKNKLRFVARPNASATVAWISAQLQEWARAEDWVADVCVIDYADILAPPAGVKDYRDQINTNWMHLRRLSQEQHCLVVTATQADAASYDKVILTRKNFSEDKRKYAHVTGMVGLNVSNDDKPLGVTRLNWLQRREEEFLETRITRAAGCLAIGCPAIISI